MTISLLFSLAFAQLPGERNFEWSLRSDNYQINKFSNSNQHFGKDSVKYFDAQYRPADTLPWIKFVPIANINWGWNTAKGERHFDNTIGAGIDYKTDNKKWSLSAYSLINYQQNSNSLDSFLLDSMNVISGRALAHKSRGKYNGANWGFRANYNPNKYVNFELGKGTHFFGNGYRTFLLSDHAAAYPYGKIETSVWKIRYTNLYSAHKDNFGYGTDRASFKNKFATSHMLSFQATKRLNLAIFETIIWQGKDTLLNRGYDMNYLNPIIFYRPVEYGLGSADNAIMGLDWSVRLWDDEMIYGQFVIDEFLLDELKADIRHAFNKDDTTINHGWWANKYAFMMGFRTNEPFNIKGLSAFTEYNLARPFIYTHGSVTQNYSHLGQALAHPLGGNFKDFHLGVNYQYKNWNLYSHFNWYTVGKDTTGVSFGSNLFQRYQNRVGTYGHTIGQGLTTKGINHKITLSYVVNRSYGAEFYCSYRVNNEKNVESHLKNQLILFGFKTRLFNWVE